VDDNSIAHDLILDRTAVDNLVVFAGLVRRPRAVLVVNPVVALLRHLLTGSAHDIG